MISGSWVDGALDAVTAASPGERSQYFESKRGDHGVICSHIEDVDEVLAAAHVDPRTLPDTGGSGYTAAWVDRQGALFLARDDMGRVPLYFRQVGATVRFSCVIADLVLDGDRLDLQMHELAQNNLGLLAGGRTEVVGIHRVPHNTCLEFTPAGLRVHRGWDPRVIMPRRRSFDDTVAAVERAIGASVTRRVAKAPQVAVHLSGGLDSGVCAAMAARLPNVSTAFSWSPAADDATPGFSESRAAAALARQFGLELVAVPEWIPTRTPLEPGLQVQNTSWREEWVVSHAAERGIDRLVSGWGGDEGVSTSGLRLGRATHARSLPRLARLLRDSREGPWPAHVAATARAALATARDRRAQARRYFAGTQGLLRPPDLNDPRLDFRRAQITGSTWMAHRLWGGGLQVRIEAWWEMGRRQGVAYRYPLLDRGVLVEALRTPEGHWHRGEPRAVMRRIARGVGFSDDTIANAKLQPRLTPLIPVHIAADQPLLLDRWTADAEQIRAIHDRWRERNL